MEIIEIKGKGFIQILNQLSYNVVLINNEIFIFTQFVPSYDLTTKHQLVGKNIEPLLNKYINQGDVYDENTIKKIQQNIEGLRSERREFSERLIWTSFLC